MRHVPLPLKYRPTTFKQLKGQEYSKEFLANSIKTKRLVRTYLFAGESGCGKTTAARIFAAAINCESPEDGYEPCGQCKSCKSIFSVDNAFDYRELNCSSNNGVDTIRQLEEEVNVSPMVGRYRVFCLDEAHQLTQQAKQAAFKLFEEFKQPAIFVLCTTNPEALDKNNQAMGTRVTVVPFTLVHNNEVVLRLHEVSQAEKLEIDNEVLQHIAFLSNGSPRKALTALEKLVNCGLEIDQDLVYWVCGAVPPLASAMLFEGIVSGSNNLLLDRISQAQVEGYDPLKLTDAIEEILTVANHKAVTNRFPSTHQYPDGVRERIDTAISQLKKEEVDLMFEVFYRAKATVLQSGNRWLWFENLLINLLDASFVWRKSC